MLLQTRRRKRDAIAKAIDEASQRFQLYANGAELFKEDENTYTILQRHLLKSAGQNIADLLLRHHEVISPLCMMKLIFIAGYLTSMS